MDVPVTEFRAHLSTMLERVRDGEQITLTERGIPVARVVAVDAADRLRELTERGVISAPERVERPRLTGVRRPRPKGAVADLVVHQRW